MRKTLFGLVLCSLLALPPVTAQALAQDQSLRPLLDRLDRLERDLNQVQRQVYRNEVGGAAAPVPDARDGGAVSLNLEIRITQLEDQMRKLTGQLEEIQYGISQITTKLEKTQTDNEIRFQQLEGAAAAPATKSGGTLDSPAAPNGKPAPPGAKPEPTAAAVGGLPSGSAQDQYNYAFGLLKQNDYKGAEAAFKAFLAKHPTDPLAGNAQYWLGQSYFVRAEYAAATSAFAESYQKFPHGAKAGDSLLKLGMSLGNTGHAKEACASFNRLDHDFPQLEPAIKQQETREKQRLGC